MTIQLIKAFTDNPSEGNPAGVIFDADNLSQEEMIQIASELCYSESVFVVKPTLPDADYRFRFMTSTTEVDACGHATLAGAQAICDHKPFESLKIETGAGIVMVTRNPDNSLMMKMSKAELGSESYSKQEIAGLLNIDYKDIMDLPLITSSVGSPKLMIPIRSLNIVKSINPNFDAMIEFCKQNPTKGFYIFTKEVISLTSNFHARQFNPAAGIYEDPITGIAGGALALYAQKYELVTNDKIIIEQGYEMNKPGEIIVQIIDGNVYVGGNAVKFGEKEV